jgi:hypothetical protein
MKSFALFAAICAVALSAGGTKTANAATLDFDFTITGRSGGQPTGDTVTGEIDGLSDNSTGPASAVILESYNVALLGAIPGCLPCDTTKSPWQIGTDSITHLPENNFTVSNGQIVAANFFSSGPNVSSLQLFSSQANSLGILAGPEEEATGGPVTFSPVAPATPLPAALPLFATGLGALGLLGWRRKRKARVSLLGAA